jgi:hypothetical protein
LLDILNVSDDDLKVLDGYVDALHAQATAAHKIAQVAKAPLINQMSGSVKTLADAAEMVNGLSDTNLGSSMISSINSVIQQIAGDRAGTVLGESTARSLRALDLYATKTLGLEQGAVRDMARNVVKAQQLSGSPSSQAVMDDIIGRLKKVVPPEMVPVADELLYHLMEAGETPLKEIGAWDEGSRIVQNAIQGGLLDPKLNPGAAAEIRKLAEEYKALMQDIYEGTPEAQRQNYAGRMLTPEAQRSVQIAAENTKPVSSSSAPQTIPVPLSKQWQADFDKQRKTIEYRWKDAVTGKEYRFIDSDRVYKSYEKEGKYLRDEEREYIKGKIEGIDAFEALGPKAQSEIPRYQLTAAEINKRVNENLFPLLIKNPLNGRKFFETSAAAVLANRVGASERKRLTDQLRSLAQQHAFDGEISLLPPMSGKKNTIQDFTTKSGVKGRVFLRDGKEIVQLGNAEYRQIFPSIAPDQNPAFALFQGAAKTDDAQRIAAGDNRQLFQQWYPTWAADLIEDSSNLFSKQDPNELLQALEESTKIWKMTTLGHPSWTINDLIGNLVLAVQKFSPKELIKHMKFAGQVVVAANRGDEEALRKLVTNIRGSQQVSGYDIVFGAGREALGNHTAQEAMLQATRAGEYLRPQTASVWEAAKSAAKGDFASARDQIKGVADETVTNSMARARASSLEDGLGRTGPAIKAKAVYSGLVDETLKRRLWAPWAKMNGQVNDFVRLSALMAAMDRGMDAGSAARFINRNMLDMGMQTATDENIRRFVPFYSWIKASGLYGVRQLVENPKFFSIAPNVKVALEEAINGEATLPQNQRPSWIRDQMAIQLGTDPDARKALTLTSSLPIEASAYAATAALTPFFGGQGVQDTLGWATNSLNPFVKAPLELGAGREFFTKRTIGKDSGDLTPTEYVMGQIRPFRELGIGQLREGPLVRAFGDSPAEGVARLALGGRIQPFDDDRRLYQLQKQGDDLAAAIRKRIGLAEREGNKEESVAQRAKLLRVYKTMQDQGLVVPKWFREPTAPVQ